MKTAREVALEVWRKEWDSSNSEEFVDAMTAALEERDGEHAHVNSVLDDAGEAGLRRERDAALAALKVATTALEAIDKRECDYRHSAIASAALAHITKLVGMP